MNSFSRRIVFAAVIVTTLSLAALGQDKKPLPFGPGETLTYDAKLSKIISGVPVGELTLAVTKGDDPDELVVKADAKSKGTILWLARFSFLYQFSSDIDGAHFRIEKTERKTTENDRVRNGEANFDYTQKRVTYTETNPAEPMKPPRKIASGIEDVTHDVVSGIYALRTLPLAVGKNFDLTVSDSGLVYDVPVHVTAREQQKTIFGRVWCFRVEPVVFGPGRMIEDKGSMSIWITDDNRRIPVRSRIDTDFGRVEIRLKLVGGTKPADKPVK
jgi:hypothetical protein